MRHGAWLASCVKPLGWAPATRLVCTPRQDLLRPCLLQLPISRQRRFLQSNPSPDQPDLAAQNDQVSQDGPKEASVKESSQGAAGLRHENEYSSMKPAKDLNWVFKFTGDRIESIKGHALKGIEEYVSHQSGTKLLCSWTLGPGDERAIWVPGDAPRVRDLMLPVDLQPKAVLEVPNNDWLLGSPQVSFEPFFASLASMNPMANFDSTDLIARSGTLHLLLGVVRGNLKQLGISGSIAFHISLVKNTLIIKKTQRPNTDQLLGRGRTPTWTGGFLNKITEMKALDGEMIPDHSQAVRYHLAHLRCVVITPVDAATGNASLPPLTVPDKPLEHSKASGSVKVKVGGRGVPPGAVTKVMTGITDYDANKRRLNYKGQLKIKPPGQSKIWFERPKAILQGHLEPSQPSASGETARLVRVSVRDAAPILDQMEDACQLELRKLVTLLDRLRDTARRVGGSCILTCFPSQKTGSGGKMTLPKFELYKCGPEAEPLVLDWHVERFWSKN